MLTNLLSAHSAVGEDLESSEYEGFQNAKSLRAARRTDIGRMRRRSTVAEDIRARRLEREGSGTSLGLAAAKGTGLGSSIDTAENWPKTPLKPLPKKRSSLVPLPQSSKKFPCYLCSYEVLVIEESGLKRCYDSAAVDPIRFRHVNAVHYCCLCSSETSIPAVPWAFMSCNTCPACQRRRLAFEEGKEMLEKAAEAARRGSDTHWLKHLDQCNALLNQGSKGAARKLVELVPQVRHELVKLAFTTKDGLDWLKTKSGVEWMGKQVELDLSNCELKELPDFIHEASAINSISVADNMGLDRLPLKALLKLQSLHSLNCMGCASLLSPPPEIARQGGVRTMQFLRAAEDHGKLNTQMLLFLIGNGKSGKTSTLRALMSPEDTSERIHEDARTVGIDIVTWQPQQTHPDVRSGDLCFKVFDLAGQAVYAMTHQYFLVRRAVYVLVWRARLMRSGQREEALSDLSKMIHSWMDSLQNRQPGASMTLVVTHIDQAGSESSLNEQCMWVQQQVARKLQELQEVCAPRHIPPLRLLDGGNSVPIDCLTGQGVSVLRRRLVQFTTKMPWFQEALPQAWVALQRDLVRKEQEGKRWMSWQEYATRCERCEVDPRELELMTSFLHDSGQLRYFGHVAEAAQLLQDKRSAELQAQVLLNTVFISLRWMVDVLKGVIRHDLDALLQWFARQGLPLQVRRVQRLTCFGLLHKELVPFLWPAMEDSAAMAYWAAVREDPLESAVWKLDVVADKRDARRALALLEGFNILARTSKIEYTVPGLISQARRSADVGLYSASHSTYCSEYVYHSLPPGGFEGLCVGAWKRSRSSHMEITGQAAVVYRRGDMGQLFLRQVRRGKSRGAEGARGEAEGVRQQVCLVVKASSHQLWQGMQADVGVMHAFFPGLAVLSTQHSLPREEVPSEGWESEEAVQVLVLGSAGRDMQAETALSSEAARSISNKNKTGLREQELRFLFDHWLAVVAPAFVPRALACTLAWRAPECPHHHELVSSWQKAGSLSCQAQRTQAKCLLRRPKGAHDPESECEVWRCGACGFAMCSLCYERARWVPEPLQLLLEPLTRMDAGVYSMTTVYLWFVELVLRLQEQTRNSQPHDADSVPIDKDTVKKLQRVVNAMASENAWMVAVGEAASQVLQAVQAEEFKRQESLKRRNREWIEAMVSSDEDAEAPDEGVAGAVDPTRHARAVAARLKLKLKPFRELAELLQTKNAAEKRRMALRMGEVWVLLRGVLQRGCAAEEEQLGLIASLVEANDLRQRGEPLDKAWAEYEQTFAQLQGLVDKVERLSDALVEAPMRARGALEQMLRAQAKCAPLLWPAVNRRVSAFAEFARCEVLGPSREAAPDEAEVEQGGGELGAWETCVFVSHELPATRKGVITHKVIRHASSGLGGWCGEMDGCAYVLEAEGRHFLVHHSQVASPPSPHHQPLSKVLKSVVPNPPAAERILRLLRNEDRSLRLELQYPNRPFEGSREVRVVVVCMDRYMGQVLHSRQQIQEHAEANRILIPVLLPGYTIRDGNYSRWWPEELACFRRHSLFIDLREASDWRPALKKNMPQIVKFLEEWRGEAPDASAFSRLRDRVPCIRCVQEGEPEPCIFDRRFCLAELERWRERELWLRADHQAAAPPAIPPMNSPVTGAGVGGDDAALAAAVTAGGGDNGGADPLEESWPGAEPELDCAVVVCGRNHRLSASDVVSSAALREALPCPICLTDGRVPPGCFSRAECLLIFSEDNANKAGSMRCRKCGKSIPIRDILAPEVFVSYNWGRKVKLPRGREEHSTQKVVRTLHQRLELLAGITCWFDVGGGMGAGNTHLEEMLEGVTQAVVFLLFLSDAYVRSANCQRELSHAMRGHKHIIVVLLPDLGPTPTGYSSGWTGPPGSDPLWWKHAEAMCSGLRVDGSDTDTPRHAIRIEWELLGKFRPTTLTEAELDAEGCIMAGSEVEQHVLRRILMRFHRGGYGG